MIGYAMCGSFCTIDRSISQLYKLIDKGYEIQPFMSETLYSTDTRFGKAADIIKEVEDICGRKVVHTIADAEPYGPAKPLDALIICPCTGNTLAKMAHGITDSSICMTAKAHMRNDRTTVIALATNDALSANLNNISTMLSRKNVYFVPLVQDDPIKKPHSLVADMDMLIPSFEYALVGKQSHKLIK